MENLLMTNVRYENTLTEFMATLECEIKNMKTLKSRLRNDIGKF